jgi:hypothetical protein
MKKNLVASMLLCTAVSMTIAQKAQRLTESTRATATITHPWWVVDGGGGGSTSGGFVLQSSIGQATVQRMVFIDTGMVLEGGYLPGLRELAGTKATMSLGVRGGWNLISVPLIVSDYRDTILYPTATSSAFKFENGYVPKDTLENGTGYWLKFPSNQLVPMEGTAITYDTITVRSGWNIIGCVSYPILISGVVPIAPVTIQGNFFLYNAGYFTEDTLKPGSGYWVKVSQAGRLVMQSGSVLESPLTAHGPKNARKLGLKELATSDAVNTIIIRDATGKTQKLYFCSDQNDVDLASCELPPPPPAGILDVRYRSQRAAEAYDEEQGGMQSFPIQIAEATYPLTVSWTLGESGGKYALEIVKPGGEQQHIHMVHGGMLTLDEPSLAFKLQIDGKPTVQLPTEFALRQNYPNPFNPSTTIKYELPVDSRVSLRVFNIIGQEVTTLVNEAQKAGYKSIEWNAANAASGTYFYRLQAGSYTSVKKLLIIK